MLKTYKYRLYPTKAQTTQLNQTLEECRKLYNHFLSERKNFFETEKKNLSYYNQAISLPLLKSQNPILLTIHSQVLQNVVMRLDLAFKAFFRRVKSGENPGYPRFKGINRYDSITYSQSGFKIKNDNQLHLSKIGDIKLIYHRPIQGKIKTCNIKKTSTNKWFVNFTVEVETQLLPKTNQVVGIDVGIESFATFSNNQKIENPHFLKKQEKELARIQRKLSKQEKGTPNQLKTKKIVSKVCEKITNKRTNFAHQESRKIINSYDIIYIEDLTINRMLKHRCLTKSIYDAAWSQFSSFLSYKAEEAGKQLMKINPAYTSQDCSNCGHRQIKKLSVRVHNCDCCKLSLDRDINAARNILSLGLQTLDASLRSPNF